VKGRRERHADLASESGQLSIQRKKSVAKREMDWGLHAKVIGAGVRALKANRRNEGPVLRGGNLTPAGG